MMDELSGQDGPIDGAEYMCEVMHKAPSGSRSELGWGASEEQGRKTNDSERPRVCVRQGERENSIEAVFGTRCEKNRTRGEGKGQHHNYCRSRRHRRHDPFPVYSLWRTDNWRVGGKDAYFGKQTVVTVRKTTIAVVGRFIDLGSWAAKLANGRSRLDQEKTDDDDRELHRCCFAWLVCLFDCVFRRRPVGY